MVALSEFWNDVFISVAPKAVIPLDQNLGTQVLQEPKSWCEYEKVPGEDKWEIV